MTVRVVGGPALLSSRIVFLRGCKICAGQIIWPSSVAGRKWKNVTQTESGSPKGKRWT